MKMNYNLLVFLIIPLLVSSSEATATESCSKEDNENDLLCGVYCYQVVKPLLSFAASIRSKEEYCTELERKFRDQEAILVKLQNTIRLTEFQLSQQIELTAAYKSNIALQIKLLASNEVLIANLQSQIKNPQNQQINAKTKQIEPKTEESKTVSIATSCFGKSTDVHTIKVPGMEPFPVPCDSELSGPGWTVIQRRKDGSQSFFQDWRSYKAGFGNLRGEFFLGLEKLHLITKSQPHELYILMINFKNERRYAQYSYFLIGNETESYQIKMLGNSSGSAGDALSNNLHMKFSTKDKENDQDDEFNCADWHMTGWWFKTCSPFSFCDLNGQYIFDRLSSTGIKWNAGGQLPIKFTQMMIRPKST